MSSLGPLGPPPTAPIVNPIMWAPELPVNRPQVRFKAAHDERFLGYIRRAFEKSDTARMHTETSVSVATGICAHLMGAGPPRPEEGAPLERHVVTPIDIQDRAALAHEMTFHRTAEASGARLDPTHPKAPFGATLKNAEGELVTEREGPVDDPYGIATVGGQVTTATAVIDEDNILGDGSLVAAEAAIEAICRTVDFSAAKI